MLIHNPEIRSALNNAWANSSPATRSAPNSDSPEHGFGYQLGAGLPDVIARRKYLKPVGDFFSNLGVNTGHAALGGTLAGGLAGLGTGLFTGRDWLRSALMGAGIGGVGSAGLSEMVRYMNQPRLPGSMVKQNFYAMPEADADPIEIIQRKLFNDSGLDARQKSGLLSLLSGLPPTQLKLLLSLVRGSVGAGVGYLIAKFLFRLGVGGTVIMSLLGGAVGAGSGSHRNQDTDAMGRRYLV